MFTQEEKIEIFQSNLNKIIQDLDLPIPIIYFVLNEYTQNIKRLYDEYRVQLGQSISQKITQQQEELVKQEQDKAVE